jgi:hypothetical protein
VLWSYDVMELWSYHVMELWSYGVMVLLSYGVCQMTDGSVLFCRSAIVNEQLSTKPRNSLSVHPCVRPYLGISRGFMAMTFSQKLVVKSRRSRIHLGHIRI